MSDVELDALRQELDVAQTEWDWYQKRCEEQSLQLSRLRICLEDAVALLQSSLTVFDSD